jgi:hypothetical protein
MQYFRTLTQTNLLKVLHGILDKVDLHKEKNEIDLSIEVLPLSTLISK